MNAGWYGPEDDGPYRDSASFKMTVNKTSELVEIHGPRRIWDGGGAPPGEVFHIVGEDYVLDGPLLPGPHLRDLIKDPEMIAKLWPES